MDALQPDDPRSVGAYRLLGRLGAGGMGRVYLGESPSGRKVAVKLIHPVHAGTVQFRERFVREIEAARLVGGFHTAPVVDADPRADPPWMVTAYIDGPSLQDAVGLEGPLPPYRVRTLGAGLAEGLAAIHACGLVHRDLKPGNVILAADGPRIIDFGIARAVDMTSGLTTTGALVGTFTYMSPEQIRGEPAGPPSDVFALGCVLAFAATGRPPFNGDSVAAVMYRVVNQPPDLTGLADARLHELIVACLAKSPQDRPRVAAVLTALTEFSLVPGAVAAVRAGVPAAADMPTEDSAPTQDSASALAETGSDRRQRSVMPASADERRPAATEGQRPGPRHGSGGRTARSHQASRSIWRRPVSIAIAIAVAVVVGVVITILNIPGTGSIPPVQGGARLAATEGLTASDHYSGLTTGYNGAIQVKFTVPPVSSGKVNVVEYGLNATSLSGTWNAPGTPGSKVDEVITGLNNGTSYVVYVRSCSDVGLCGPWVGPSNLVTPYGMPAAPTVSAQTNGTSIAYTWGGGGGNGRPISIYHVCFGPGSCSNTRAGGTITSYGYSQTHSITVYAVDTAGQHSAMASASATTVAAHSSVSVSRGPAATGTAGDCPDLSRCSAVEVTVSDFPAGSALSYECSDGGDQFWPASGLVDRDFSGGVVTAGGDGSATFTTQCIWGSWSNSAQTLTVTVNGVSGSFRG